MQPCVRHLNERQTRVGAAKKPQLLPFCLSLRAPHNPSIAGGLCAVQTLSLLQLALTNSTADKRWPDSLSSHS